MLITIEADFELTNKFTIDINLKIQFKPIKIFGKLGELGHLPITIINLIKLKNFKLVKIKSSLRI